MELDGGSGVLDGGGEGEGVGTGGDLTECRGGCRWREGREPSQGWSRCWFADQAGRVVHWSRAGARGRVVPERVAHHRRPRRGGGLAGQRTEVSSEMNGLGLGLLDPGDVVVELGVVQQGVPQLGRDWRGDEGRPVMVELGREGGEGSEGFDGGEALDRLEGLDGGEALDGLGVGGNWSG